MKESNKEMAEELIMEKREKMRLEDELKVFKSNLIKLRVEYEQENKNDKQIFNVISTNKKFEAKINEMQVHLAQKDQEKTHMKEQLESVGLEKERLEEEVEYFKNMARMAKVHAEKAIADVDTYRDMLRKISQPKLY